MPKIGANGVPSYPDHVTNAVGDQFVTTPVTDDEGDAGRDGQDTASNDRDDNAGAPVKSTPAKKSTGSSSNSNK